MNPTKRPLLLIPVALIAALLALVPWLNRFSVPIAVSTPAPSTPRALATPEPPPRSPEAPPAKMDAVEWALRFKKFFGLPKAKLAEELAALGFPLSERTLDALLKNSHSAEEFTDMLLKEIILFHPNRLVADAIKNGLPAKVVWNLLESVSSTWQRRRLESWTPSTALIELMRSEFAGDEATLKQLARFRRPYGNPMDADPIALGKQLLAIPAEQRKKNQVMQLALGWPADRAHEMAAWGAANLQGKERADFFARIAYPAYASGDPDLALRLLDAISDPADRGLVAPMVAATLMQHDRPDEALALLDQLEGAGRMETVKMAAKHWALRDPDAAIAWANELPTNEFNTALNGMFEHLPAPTMRAALDNFAKGPVDPVQDAAILRGLSRTTSWTDTATAADVIPSYYAARGFAPLAAPTSEMWKGTPEQQSRALQYDVAARTIWSLSQKEGAAAALAWADRVQWATPQDKLIAQAYALPETVEIYEKHSVLGPIRGWINQQLADPAKRTALETRLAQMRTAPR